MLEEWPKGFLSFSCCLKEQGFFSYWAANKYFCVDDGRRKKKRPNPVPAQNDQDCRGSILVNERESLSELMLSAWGDGVSAKHQLSGEGGKTGMGFIFCRLQSANPSSPKLLLLHQALRQGARTEGDPRRVSSSFQTLSGEGYPGSLKTALFIFM